MKYVRFKNNTVVEIIDFDPTGKYHPSIEWHECPNDEVEQNWTTDGFNFYPPEVEEEDQTPSEPIEPEQADLLTQQVLLLPQVNNIRYSKIYQDSIPYTFPGDSEPDGVQMRNEVDRQNIQDLVIDASLRDPADPMVFMPTSNTLKTLTARDIVDMGKYLKARGDQIVAYSWTLKSQIKAAQTIEDLPDIQAGWPV